MNPIYTALLIIMWGSNTSPQMNTVPITGNSVEAVFESCVNQRDQLVGTPSGFGFTKLNGKEYYQYQVFCTKPSPIPVYVMPGPGPAGLPTREELDRLRTQTSPNSGTDLSGK